MVPQACRSPATRRTLGVMEVHFAPELEARLAQSAAQQGRKPDELVQEVVARHFDEESRLLNPAVLAKKLCGVANTLRTSRSASAWNVFCDPDGGSLVSPSS